MSQCITARNGKKLNIQKNPSCPKEGENLIALKTQKILIKKVQNVLKCQKKIIQSIIQSLSSMGALPSSCPSQC